MARRYANTDAPIIAPENEKPLLNQDGVTIILLDAAEKRLALKKEVMQKINDVQEYAEDISSTMVSFQNTVNQTIENITIAAMNDLTRISYEAIEEILNS